MPKSEEVDDALASFVPKAKIPKEKSDTYIHIRVDHEFKRDILKKAKKQGMNLTNFVSASLEPVVYPQEIDKEEESSEELLDEILTAMENLERRIEIRLSTLQDTFNSLIGKLLDFEKAGRRPRKKHKKGKQGEEAINDTDLNLDTTRILLIEPEKQVYQRVKLYIESKGVARAPDFSEILNQLETDGNIKEFLDDQDSSFPGWKGTLIRDAIDEALEELGIAAYQSGGFD